MPTRPAKVNLDGKTVDILNAVRNSASQNYRSIVPVAENTPQSIRDIGSIIVGYPAIANEFLNNLVNRIGMVIISSKMYDNPWSMFKRGMLEYGETIEEIFVNIAKPFEYDVERSENEVFKREIADVESTFHILNYRKFYKTTIQQETLRQAFTSVNGVTDLINRIIDSLYAGAEFDEFQTMKYLIAQHILAGDLYPVEVDTSEAKGVVARIKSISNNLEFMSPKYNIAGVNNFSKKDTQYLIVNADFDAIMDVDVLASAFNMSKVEFMGHRVLVDGFGELDKERLNMLFAESPGYVEITDEQLAALNAIPAIIVDRDWFMILDNMQKFTEQFNGEGLYWNYWLHTWKTFSVSPFANSVMFIPGTPSVTDVSVTPSTATVSAGSTVTLQATVTTTNFASKAVDWNCDEDKATVSFGGVVNISPKVPKGTTITVTCTSRFDRTKSSSATLTVA